MSIVSALAAIALLVTFFLAPVDSAKACASTSQGLTPIMDLGPGTYQGYQGGLYPSGQNVPPQAYLDAGIAAGQRVIPVNGKIGLLGIGMSNAELFFDAFMEQARADDPQVNPGVTLVNGSQASFALTSWLSPTASVWSSVDRDVRRAGLSNDQVLAVWVLNVRSDSPWKDLGPFPAMAQLTKENFTTLAGVLDTRYPNLKQIHVSSLNYMGYGITSSYPYAEPRQGYENEFSLKWLIEDRITGATSGRSWIGWNASLWADGEHARSDGMTWLCSDYSDNIHPNATGAAKGAAKMLAAYLADPTTPWFRR